MRTDLNERASNIGDTRSEINGMRDVRDDERFVRRDDEREREVVAHVEEAMLSAHPIYFTYWLRK